MSFPGRGQNQRPHGDTHVVGRIRIQDGTTIRIIKHVAKRYRQRVEPELEGWPDALARLRFRAKSEGVISDERPEWLHERDSEGRQPNRWLVFEDCALPLRGRQQPKAITVMTP